MDSKRHREEIEMKGTIPDIKTPDFHNRPSQILQNIVKEKNETSDDLQKAFMYVSSHLPRTISMPFQANCFQASKSSKFFVLGSSKGRLAVTDSRELTKDINIEIGIKSLVLFHDDTFVFVGLIDKTIRKYQLSTFELVDTYSGHQDKVTKLLLSRNDLFLFSASADGTVREWPTNSPKEAVSRIVYKHENEIIDFDLSYDGAHFASCSKIDGVLKVYSVAQNKDIALISNEYGATYSCVKFSPKKTYLAAGDMYSRITLWNFTNLSEPFKSLMGSEDKIRDLTFTYDESTLISASKDTNIRLWSLNTAHDEIVLTQHTESVKGVIVGEGDQHIFSLGKDYMLRIWKIPRFKRHRKLLDHTDTIWRLKFSKNSNRLYSNSDDQRIIIWDHTTGEKLQELFHYVSMYAMAIVKDESQLISCTDDGKIIFWNLETFKRDREIASEEGIIRSLIMTQTYFITGDEAFRVVVWDLKSCNVVHIFRTHRSAVWSLTDYEPENKLYSGDEKGAIMIHDMTFNSPDHGELEGHTTRVQRLKISRNGEILISGSRDGIIKIWSVKMNSLLRTIEYHTAVLREIYCTKDQKYFFVCSEDCLMSIFDMREFSLITSIRFKKKLMAMTFTDDELTIALAEESTITIIENPVYIDRIGSSDVRVYGPGSDYMNFLNYCSQIMLNQSPDYDPQMDAWIIQPFRLNALHLYAYFNLPRHLKLGIKNLAPFISTRHMETALSLSLKKNFGNCVQSIFKVFDKRAEKNIHIFNSIENSLIDLNRKGFPGLDRFYQTIVIRWNDQGLPKFCRPGKSLPKVIYSDFIIPKSEKFMNPAHYTKDGKAIMFLIALVRLNLTMGSKESLEFLDSLEDCPETSIFNTYFIKTILREKWIRISWLIDIQTAIYIGYLVSFAYYTSRHDNEGEFLTAPFVFNQVLTVYEIFQIWVGGIYYWKTWTNYLDIARIFLFDAYSLVVWTTTIDNIEYFEAAVIALTWFRGITYFRIFKPTRYLINLLYEVMWDMIPFLVTLFYSTTAFAVIYSAMVTETQDLTFFSCITTAWRMNIGDFSTDTYDSYLTWGFHWFFTVLNPIILINLLISLMGTTFGRVQENRDVADSLELVNMIIEGETLLFWRRNAGQKTYLQVCLEEDSLEDQNVEEEVRKLKRVKLKLENMKKEAETNDEESTAILDKIAFAVYDLKNKVNYGSGE